MNDDGVYLVSGLSTRRSRNLTHNPYCTIATPRTGIDLVIEPFSLFRN
ncbi:hypothetical protein [Nocardia sp. NPDC003963]